MRLNELLTNNPVPANCEYIDMPGSYLPFTDTYISNVPDLEGCRDECNRQVSAYILARVSYCLYFNRTVPF